MKRLVLGVVADDFTGASDAASFLTAAGVPVMLFNGTPRQDLCLNWDSAVVIALKTRTEPAPQAVEESLEAFRWLKDQGAEQLYLKYCSTFDSTDKGNIGPVVDAVMAQWHIPVTVLCPSLPVNGRTVKDGILYVNGIPLEESSMKDHPLTPMRISRIDLLMERQARGKCRILPEGEGWNAVPEEGIRYLIPDYHTDAQGERIAQTFGHLPFLTGGSGLAGCLGREIAKTLSRKTAQTPYLGTEGKGLLLAGSCSKATLGQIADHIQRGYPALRLRPELLVTGEQTAESLWQWVQEAGSGALVYSSAEPEDLAKSQALSRERIAVLIETTLSALAKMAADHGYHRIIVAGGETSGAVTRALGYDAFSVGDSVAPGVPVMTPLENPALRLVLKSGNFGQTDFFARAMGLTGV